MLRRNGTWTDGIYIFLNLPSIFNCNALMKWMTTNREIQFDIKYCMKQALGWADQA